MTGESDLIKSTTHNFPYNLYKRALLRCYFDILSHFEKEDGTIKYKSYAFSFYEPFLFQEGGLNL